MPRQGQRRPARRTPGRTAADMSGDSAAHRIATALVHEGLLDPRRTTDAEAVVARALRGPSPAHPPGSRTQLVEITGYLGAALVFSAVGLFLSEQWQDLGDLARTLWLAGIAALLAASGAVAAVLGSGYEPARSGREEVRRRLSSALLTSAAGVAGAAVGHQVEVVRDAFDSWPSLAGSVTALVLCAAVYAVMPSVFTVAGLALSTFVATTSAGDLIGSPDSPTLATGLLLVAAGAVWVTAAERSWLAEQTLGRIAGSAMLLLGAQMPVFDTGPANVGYALLVLVAAFAFTTYLRTVAWPYLVLGVGAVTLVVPQAVIDWTSGSLGTAGGVLVAGLTLLAASFAGFRMRQEAAGE